MRTLSMRTLYNIVKWHTRDMPSTGYYCFLLHTFANLICALWFIFYHGVYAWSNRYLYFFNWKEKKTAQVWITLTDNCVHIFMIFVSNFSMYGVADRGVWYFRLNFLSIYSYTCMVCVNSMGKYMAKGSVWTHLLRCHSLHCLLVNEMLG